MYGVMYRVYGVIGVFEKIGKSWRRCLVTFWLVNIGCECVC